MKRIKNFKTLLIISLIFNLIFLVYGIHKINWKYKQYKRKQQELTDNPWRKNFPKSLEQVKNLPHSDSLWIFFMAGQSNMAGRGFVEPQDTVPNKRIITIDESMNWIYAKEPLHFYEPSLTGLDCGLSFSKNLLESIPEGISIAIIPCAIGGSSIEQWIYNETFRGVKLIDNFKEKVDFSRNYGTIKGIIWHQGESNAKSEMLSKYPQRLDSLINKFRVLVENDSLPIILGELGSYTCPIDKQMRWDSINNSSLNFKRL